VSFLDVFAVQLEDPGRPLLGLNVPLHGALAMEQIQDVERDVAVGAEDGTSPDSACQVEGVQIGAGGEVLAQLDLDAERGRQRCHRFNAPEIGA
jgi:hypothetical protein